MTQLVKTTVTIPEDLFREAKLAAVQEKVTFSRILREALDERIHRRNKRFKKNPLRLAGRFKLGVNQLYKKRSDLYDEHIRRKMGF